MKTTLLLLFLLPLMSVQAQQINGTTESGDAVILYADGTWAYADKEMAQEQEPQLNKKKFKKAKSQDILVESQKVNMGIWINPEKWKSAKGTGDSEFEFELKGGDAYALMISEQIEIPLKTLKRIALMNAQSAAPDARIIHQEYRMVNKTKVLMLRMNGTIDGIKFAYLGYYYSNENGTVQLLAYTGQSLMTKYQDDIETFLNGFVELDE